jgi:DNA-binding beta-propeller fold protein YncE
LALAAGCQGPWQAREVTVLEGFEVPESVRLHGPVAYVTNIVADTTKEGSLKYWSDDGAGYISVLNAGQTPSIRTRKWVSDKMDAPKGMAVVDGRLWLADNSKLLWVDLHTGKVSRFEIPDTGKLNDVATDGKSIYVSDMGKSRIYKIDGDKLTTLPAPPDVNGIAFHLSKMYVVSWSVHEVYRMDPSGQEEPRPLGVAEHFTNLDGIEILDDGSILVSDFYGNKVSVISPETGEVRTLAELTTPADIGLDRENLLLYVPQFLSDKVVVYQLSRQPG